MCFKIKFFLLSREWICCKFSLVLFCIEEASKKFTSNTHQTNYLQCVNRKKHTQQKREAKMQTMGSIPRKSVFFLNFISAFSIDSILSKVTSRYLTFEDNGTSWPLSTLVVLGSLLGDQHLVK
jgi:hypothetical protein